MEHLYTVHTKIIQEKTYYFVKKLLALPEFKGVSNVVVGYGMHTDFEKACSIAGIDDKNNRQQLLAELEKRNMPRVLNETLSTEISETVNQWLAECGTAILN